MDRVALGAQIGLFSSDPNVTIIRMAIACCGLAMAVVLTVAAFAG